MSTYSPATGKEPAGDQNGTGHVNQPSADEVQPRYARQAQPADISPNEQGWYAGFSKYIALNLFRYDPDS